MFDYSNELRNSYLFLDKEDEIEENYQNLQAVLVPIEKTFH